MTIFLDVCALKKSAINFPRSLSLFVIMMLFMGLLPLRIVEISFSNTRAGSTQSSKSLELSTSRGVVYDINLNRLVADKESLITAVKPCVEVLSELNKVLNKADFDAAAEELVHGNPLALELGNSLSSEYVLNIPIYKRYNSSSLATHIIGYLDDEGENGISGIEKSFNSFLNEYSGTLRARFYSGADGSLIAGEAIEPVDENYNSNAGVVLTVNKAMQAAVENAMDECGLERGAAVMLNVKTGAIAAIVSRPNFSRENISAALNSSDLPLFNRALGEYPVGSVFKPLVALTALEQGGDPSEEYVCRGYCVVNGHTFNCLKEHGSVDMASALCYSCNCYFINLIEKIDCSQLLDFSQSLGFGKSLELADGIETYSGNLPDINQLSSSGEKANFSFGQGSLTANVLQVASLYAAIAAGGDYAEPYLIEGLCDENGQIYDRHEIKPAYRLFCLENTQLISSFLELAVREGTGKTASVNDILVCGKTATAQSGDFSGKSERLVTWFAGYYPYENPEYVLVVMCEDGESGSADCAPVFSKAVTAILNNY